MNRKSSLGLNNYIEICMCRHPDSAMDIAASNAAYELTKISEAAYE